MLMIIQTDPHLHIPQQQIPGPARLYENFQLLPVPVFSVPLHEILFQVLRQMPDTGFQFYQSDKVCAVR